MRSISRVVAAVAVVASATVVVSAAAPAHPVAAADAVYSVRTDLVVRDVVYDPWRDLLYASVDQTDPVHPNQVVTIDPLTWDIVATASLGTIPSEMDLSDDGAALFVGIDGQSAVKKVALPDFTVVWTHSIGTYQSFAPPHIGDVRALPGSSDVVAVSRRLPGISPEHAGIVIIDSTGARPTISAGHIGSDSIVFDPSSSRLYGSDLGSSAQRLFTHEIDATGITTLAAQDGLGGGTIAATDGLVVGSNGIVLDVSGAAPVLADTVIGGRSVAVDTGAGVFYIGNANGTLAKDVRAYDLVTRDLVGEWTVSAQGMFAMELEPFGDGMLAMIDKDHPFFRFGRLVLVDLTRAASPPTTTPPPTVPPTVPPVPPVPPVVQPVPPVPPAGPGTVDLGSLGEYTPLTPQRIVDTRSGLGRAGSVTPLGAAQQIDIQIAGIGGVPASGVDAVVVNVTAVSPSEAGYLSVWPSGLPLPTISSLNFAAGDTVANLVTVRVGADGRVSLFNPFGQVDVLVDVAGFYSSEVGPDGLRFRPKTPTRILDTRDPVRYDPRGALRSGETRRLSTFWSTGVPDNAQAVVLNVTVTGTTAPSYLSVYPSDVERPVVSNLNYGPGATRANQVVVRVPPSREISIYNHLGNAHVIVDVVGWFDNGEVGDAGRFIAVDPYRSIDTRMDSPWPAPGHLPAGATLRLIDDSVRVSAFAMNVTVTDTTGVGFVTAYPIGAAQTPAPLASTLNYAAGATVPNHAIVPAAPYVAFYNSGGRVHLVVDVFGVFL